MIVGIIINETETYAEYTAIKYTPTYTYEFSGEGLKPYLLKQQLGNDNEISIFKQIITEADKYNLEPTLIASVIESESNFREGVVSNAGAIGIMQIMPPTGEWLARLLEKEYKEEYLYDPLYNIELGCFYLNMLLDRYDGNIHSALTAYNRGIGGLEEFKRKNKTTISGYSEKIIERVEQY